MIITENIYKNYLNALLKGDKKKAYRLVDELLDKDIEIKNLYENLFQKSLYEVGLMWENNEISVAVEHFATAITESILTYSFSKWNTGDYNGKSVFMSTTPGEFHQVGARMIADIFEVYGWDSRFFGVNVPVKDLIKHIKTNKPDLLAFSTSLHFNLPNLKQLLLEINSELPESEIIIGGQAFRWGADNIFNELTNVRIIKDIDSLKSLILKV